MIENGRTTIPISKITKVKTPAKDTMTKVAADLLTPNEITAIMKACPRTEDRALIMTLSERAFRIGEVCRLTWGDLKGHT